MDLSFSVLASGSKANCTLMMVDGQCFLLDCGLSAKQIELRMGLLGIDPTLLTGILISHEHSDHTRGLTVLSRRYRLPVFTNKKTAARLPEAYAIELFETGQSFSLGKADIHPFRITHDAVDPVGFTIQAQGLKLAYATDIGKVNSLLIEALSYANAVILESNHDREMLMTCDYTWELKQRIASSHGHLENTDAANCIQAAYTSDLNYLVLAHLSENSNRPELARQAASQALAQYNFNAIFCADPYSPTQLFCLGQENKDFNSLTWSEGLSTR